MELKVNIDTKSIAQHLLQGMTMQLHGAILGFVQQKFTPGGVNPMFPAAGPGMAQPYHPNFNPNGHAYGQPPQQFPFQQPQPFPQFQQLRQYYSPEIFKKYVELMDHLSTDESLTAKLETILVAHVQEFLDMPLNSQQQQKF